MHVLCVGFVLTRAQRLCSHVVATPYVLTLSWLINCTKIVHMVCRRVFARLHRLCVVRFSRFATRRNMYSCSFCIYLCLCLCIAFRALTCVHRAFQSVIDLAMVILCPTVTCYVLDVYARKIISRNQDYYVAHYRYGRYTVYRSIGMTDISL